MILNKAHFLLFSPFFREVGKKRKVVQNLREWLNEIAKLDGFDDVFTSVYPLDGTVDKIFFDIDDKDDIERAFAVACQLYESLRKKNYTLIPVFTGGKGFHIYVLLEPRKYSKVCVEKKKRLLANATYFLLEEAQLIENDKVVKQIDTHVIGDLRRLTRVPNTLRTNKRAYCIFLPDNFTKLNIEEIIELSKHLSPDYSYKINDLPTLFDFPVVLRGAKEEEFKRLDRERSIRVPANVREYLKRLLRPCIFHELLKEEPEHHIRVAATIDLLNLGFSPEEIIQIYSRLGWVDFDWKKTSYQVYQIAEKGYRPYSCRKLREIVGKRYCERCY